MASPPVAEGLDRAVSPERIMVMVASSRRCLALLLLVVAVSVAGVDGSKSLNISNNCSYTVWPGILAGAGSTTVLGSTGFDELAPGDSRAMPVPSGWSGRIWGRALCSTDAGTGKFTCVTGDCGSGKPDCAGGGPAPPVTLAQFTVDGRDGMDSYDVSLVDGFNLPVLVAPQGAAPDGGNCAPTGCVVDLNGACPAELRVTSAAAGPGAAAVACKSACLAFGLPQYCCTGEFGDPSSCVPTAYSEFFKSVCPRALSYAYDSATFTCGGGDTTCTITFCPSITTSGARSSSPNSQPPPLGAGDLPPIDVTVVANTGGGNQFWGVVAATLSVLAVLLGGIFGCFKYMLKRRAQGAAAAAELY